MIRIFHLISNHKPRKGTETLPMAWEKTCWKEFQTTNPARGRKHTCLIVEYMPPFSNFKPQTPQGDGNFALAFALSFSRCISNHKPRKGTETIVLAVTHNEHLHHFKPQTPQGDGNKLRNLALVDEDAHNFKPQTPQGDGNFIVPTDTSAPIAYFKPQTPQGDGND